MNDSAEPRRWYISLGYVFLPVASIAIFFLTRQHNASGDFQPIFEKVEIRSNHDQSFDFDCVVSGSYEIGFEFLQDLSVKDFEKLVYLPTSPLPIEWKVTNRDSLIAKGSFQEFSFREISLRKVRVMQRLVGLRNVADLKRRIVRGVGKFDAIAGQAYRIHIHCGEIPADISKTDPRFLLQRNRRLMQSELSKSIGLVGLSGFLLFLTFAIWGYQKIRFRFSSEK